jgi:hypothetical protein
MTPSLTNFKAELERTLRIVKWDPSERDLMTIAQRAASTRWSSPADLRRIVVEVYPKALFLNLEGLDNSDLRTLLALATAAASKG